MNEAPIGIFDSGFGGLSVWKECKALLPNEQFIYIADQAYCPYGPKSQDAILQRARELSQYFLKKGAKLIIIACNTATAAAIKYLREEFDIPFVGMEPAIKPAALDSQTGHIGILATQGTFAGQHFQNTREKFAQGVELHIQVGEGLVELVESGKIDGPECLAVLAPYLLPMKAKGIDQLVLGCTHYPFLSKAISAILGEGVKLIDPAPAVARQLHNVLEGGNILSKRQIRAVDIFYTSGSLISGQKSLNKLEVILGMSINLSHLSLED
ncbi:MAG: glutamate racemase [Bacteroidia bacterium]|nr:glutamate racemase [Bacteroidia bacterium]